MHVDAQLVSDRRCFSWAVNTIGMAPGTLEVYHPISRFVANGMGRIPRYSPQVWLQEPVPVGFVGQGCGDSCLKSQTRLRFRVVGIAVLIYRPRGELFRIRTRVRV